jgi:hypothetical protein
MVSMLCGASPERMFARLAPSAYKQAAAVRAPALDLGGVARVVGHDRAAALFLPPAEGGHVVVVAVEQPGLAGAGLRGPVGLPALEAVVLMCPARERRRVAVAHRAPQDVVGEAVDLEAQQAWHVRRGDEVGAPELAPHDVAVPQLGLVEREQAADEGRDGGQPEHDDERRSEPVDVHAIVDQARRQQDGAVEDERAEPERRDRERQREAHEQRPHDRVGEPEQDGERERAQRPVDREARQERAQHEQGERVEHEHDEDAADEHARGQPSRTQRKPTWLMPVSIICGRRAAGRYRRQ